MKALVGVSLIFLLCFQICLKAQPDIDSLKALLSTTHKAPDKLEILGKISWAYINYLQLDMASQYADSIRLLAEELHNEERIVYAQFYYGVIARYRGNYAEALDHLHQFVTYNEKTGDATRVASGLFQIGVVNKLIGDYDKSLEAFFKILKIYENDSDYLGVGYTLNGIGVIYKNMKKYDSALVYQLESLLIRERLPGKNEYAATLQQVGYTYYLLKNYAEAKLHLIKSFELAREIKAKPTLRDIYYLRKNL